MNRYPGIRPFRSDERHLFFGRADDTGRLLRLILLEKIVILYGKSGYGKSSLLQAGVCPRLLETGELPFREIRLGPCKPGAGLPASTVLSAVALAKADTGATEARLRQGAGGQVIDTLFPNDESLWLALKKRQIATGAARFLLIFDQFEELFTYPAEQIADFKRQLAEALYTLVPDRFGRALAKNPGALAPEDQAAFYTPLELKVVFSIRADRMSQLNTLKDYLPNLLQHAYLLDALDEKQATAAVVEPAALRDPFPDKSSDATAPLPVGTRAFDTPPFSYEPAALSLIFRELRDQDTGKIETSALQIVCKHVEDNIVNGRQSDASHLAISSDDLGDIKAIFRQFYDRTIAGLPPAEQSVARHIVEDLLIKDGVRLPFAAQALLSEPGVSAALLQKLTDASLLRVERDEQGRMIYEIGHDTLVKPISEAADARRAREENERLQLEAAEQRLEKEKALRERRRARLLAAGAIVLALFAVAASVFAVQKARVAAEKTLLAEQNQEKADTKAEEAGRNLRMAEENEKKARLAYEEAQSAKTATEEQKKVAEKNYRDAQRALEDVQKATAKVAESLLRDAAEEVYHLRYEGALEKLEAAAKLGERKPDIGRALLEIAYFYTEAGQLPEAERVAGEAAALIGKPLVWPDAAKTDARSRLRRALAGLDGAVFDKLETRYYPVMLPLKGGTFLMGRDSTRENGSDDELPRHEVHLADFRLAATETTFWQYGLYCAATGQKVKEHSPSWGIDGDNPVVNVTWYAAVVYANWLSERFGRQPAYMIDSTDKEQYQWDVTLLEDKNGFRLPAEAEWEYAARGGDKGLRDYYLYAGSDSLDLVAWYSGNSEINGVSRTHPVARKQPNAPGLYDMSGNVWERCQDWYGEQYYEQFRASAAENPRGPESGDYRVVRGGSWYDDNLNSRVSNRSRNYPYNWYYNYGFRLAGR